LLGAFGLYEEKITKYWSDGVMEYWNDGVTKVERFRVYPPSAALEATRVHPPQAWFSKGKVPSSGFRVQRLYLLEIPNRRWFDIFQPGTLNREPISLAVSL
jgi:hypothetical protein